MVTDYISFIVQQNKYKSERQLIEVYSLIKQMKLDGEKSLANMFETALIYILRSKSREFRKKYNYIKGVIDRNGQNRIHQDDNGLIS